MQNQPPNHQTQPNTNQNELDFQQQNQTATFVISPENTPIKSQQYEDEENRQTINIEGNSSEQNRQQVIEGEEQKGEQHQQQQEEQRGGQQQQGVGQQQQQQQEGEQGLNEGLYETLYFQPPSLSDHNHSSKEQNEVSHIQEEHIQPQEHIDQRMEPSAQLIEEQRDYRSEAQHIYEQQGIQQEWRDQEVIINYNRTQLSDFTIKNEDYNFVGLSNDEETPPNIESSQSQLRRIEPVSVNIQNNILPSTIKSQIIKKQAQPQAKTQKSSPQLVIVQATKQQPLPSNVQNKSKASQVKPKPAQAKSISTKSPTKPEEPKKSQIKRTPQVQSKKTQIKVSIQQFIPPPTFQRKQQQIKSQEKKVIKTIKKDSPAKKVEDQIASNPVQKNTQVKQKEKQATPKVPPTKTVTVIKPVEPKKQVQKAVPIQKSEKPKATINQQPKQKVQGEKVRQQNANRNLRLYYGLSGSIEPVTKEQEVKVQQSKRQEEIQVEERQVKTNSNVLLLLKNKGLEKQEQHPPAANKQEQHPPVKIGKKKKKKKAASSNRNDQKPKAVQSKEPVLPNTDTSLTNFNQGKKNPRKDSENNDSNRDRRSVIHESRQPSEPSLPQERNMVNIINSQLISSVYESKLPPLTSLTIVKQAEKQRVGTTYKMFLKYTFQYIRTIQNYKRIVSDISIELQRKKGNKRPLQNTLEQYFINVGKLNRDFNQKCYKFQVQSQLVSASNNPFANIRLQLKKGFDEMVYLRKSIANNSNRLNGYINAHVLPSIKKAFQAYYSLVSQQQIKQYQRRDQHFRRQKVFNRVMSKLDNNFNKGLQGKYKEDLFIEITKFINQQKIHRISLRNYGRGLIDLRQTYIKCEKELFDKLQDIINRLKIQQRSIYTNVRDFNQVLDYTHQIKETTKFIQLCTLTDMDYIKYVLEIQNKKETNQFTNRHFESYLDLIFFDRVVGNIRDMLKGATNKVFPMENASEQLIHSISGNMVLFNRENDLCKDKYEIKNVNAKIIGAGFIEFDQLLKGFIFDDNRTIRLKLRDEDRAQELICYLNEKQEDIVLQHSRSQVY